MKMIVERTDKGDTKNRVIVTFNLCKTLYFQSKAVSHTKWSLHVHFFALVICENATYCYIQIMHSITSTSFFIHWKLNYAYEGSELTYSS